MCGTHLEHLERHASTICKAQCGCEANPLHTVACMAGAPQSDVAHFAALARAAPWSLPAMSMSMVSTGPSSLPADLSRQDEALLRYGGRVWITYATSVPAMGVLLHLGDRRSLGATSLPHCLALLSEFAA